MTRKLKNFDDPNLDIQIMELVRGVNGIQHGVELNDECSDLSTAIALLNQMRSALIASGIAVAKE